MKTLDAVARWRDMVTSRFSDGLIADEWVISDLAERFLLALKQPKTGQENLS